MEGSGFASGFRELDMSAPIIGRDEELKVLKEWMDRAAEGTGSTVIVSGQAGIGKTRLLAEGVDYASEIGMEVLPGRCLQQGAAPYLPFSIAFRRAKLEYLLGDAPPTIHYALVVDSAGRTLCDITSVKDSGMDMDIFGAMLEAVQGFVRDSLEKMAEGADAYLDTLGYGKHRFVIRRGSGLSVVVVISGKESVFLTQDLENAMAVLENRYAEALRGWDGDLRPFRGMEGIVRPLLSRYCGKRETSKLESQQAQMFERVAETLRERSRETPLLMILDDIQWADASTLQLLHYISRNTHGERVLICCTIRPEEVRPGHLVREALDGMQRERLIEEIDLEPLNRDETGDLLSFHLGIDAPGSFVEEISSRSGGNPFFIEELIRALESEGMIDRTRPETILQLDQRRLMIPHRVQDVINRRIDRLDAASAKGLKWASVVGLDFDYDVLFHILKPKMGAPGGGMALAERLAGKSADEIAAILAETRSATMDADAMSDLLRTVKDAKLVRQDVRGYHFDSVMVWEAVYRRIEEAALPEMHAVVGGAVEELNAGGLDAVLPLLAYHFSKACGGKQPADVRQKARRYSLSAGDKAVALLAPDEGLRYYEQALGLFDDGDDGYAEALERAAGVADTVGEWERAIQLYGLMLKAAERKGDSHLVAMARKSIGWMHEKSARWNEARLSFESALDGLTLDAERANCHRGLGKTYWREGRYEQAVSVIMKAISEAENSGARSELATALNDLGACYDRLGDFDRAEEAMTRSVAILEELGDLNELARVYNNLGASFSYRENWPSAVEQYTKSVDVAKRAKFVRGIGYGMTNLAESLMHVGDMSSAEAALADGLSNFDKINDPFGKATVYRNMGLLSREKGECERAQALFNRSLDHYLKLSEHFQVGDICEEQAITFEKMGKADEAMSCLERARDSFKQVAAEDRLERVLTRLNDIGRPELNPL